MYYLEGKSLGEIKDILEGTNIPSPQNRLTWSKQLLSNILSNVHYLGSDIYPPIITQEVFDKVQVIKSAKAAQFAPHFTGNNRL